MKERRRGMVYIYVHGDNERGNGDFTATCDDGAGDVNDDERFGDACTCTMVSLLFHPSIILSLSLSTLLLLNDGDDTSVAGDEEGSTATPVGVENDDNDRDDDDEADEDDDEEEWRTFGVLNKWRS
jgi:hypothetical protein